MNARSRRVALYAIAAIAILASGNALAHSYAGLYDWAIHHRLTGWQAMSWPAEIDVFLAVGDMTVPLTLTFRHAGQIHVDAAVTGSGSSPELAGAGRWLGGPACSWSPRRSWLASGQSLACSALIAGAAQALAGWLPVILQMAAVM